MVKNTMMRYCIHDYLNQHSGSPYTQLKTCCRGNIGFVFTYGNLSKVRVILESNIRPAPAQVGIIAPSINVIVPKGPTGYDPNQSTFFQTLQT